MPVSHSASEDAAANAEIGAKDHLTFEAPELARIDLNRGVAVRHESSGAEAESGAHDVPVSLGAVLSQPTDAEASRAASGFDECEETAGRNAPQPNRGPEAQAQPRRSPDMRAADQVETGVSANRAARGALSRRCHGDH